MPAWVSGPECARDGCDRVAWRHGLCYTHLDEERTTGRPVERSEGRYQALLDAGEVHDAGSVEFSRELRAWLDKEAA